MKFEYDPNKSQINKAEHGIDFETAKELWTDIDRLEAPVLRPGEQHFLIVGSIKGVFWTVIVTYRGNAIRIISMRRSRTEEVRYYETGKNNS